MLIELTAEEASLIIDMMNYAEDPCMDTFWAMMSDDLEYELKDKDKADEKRDQLYDLSYDIKAKLRKIK